MFYSHTNVVFPVALAAGVLADRLPHAIARHCRVRETMTAQGSQYCTISPERRNRCDAPGFYNAMFRRIDRLQTIGARGREATRPDRRGAAR